MRQRKPVPGAVVAAEDRSPEGAVHSKRNLVTQPNQKDKTMMLRTLSNAARLALLAGLLVIGVGCDSGGPDDDKIDIPNLTGSWFGTTTVQGATFTADLQVSETGGIVNANGTLVFVEPIAVSATGTYNFPQVSMTIRSTGLEDLNFNATLSADGESLTGSMRGSGFDNFGITLRRN